MSFLLCFSLQDCRDKVEQGGEIYHEIERTLELVKEVPVLSKQYLEQKTKLINIAMHAKKGLQASSRAYIHYIYEGAEPVAVFKSNCAREYEILTWELACLFGVEEVFTPAMKLTLDGVTGELQLYRPGDVFGDAKYSEALYPLVTFDSYLKCALGVLLFALEDMHNENCYFTYQREGYLKMGLFDTLAAFYLTDIAPHNVRAGYPSIQTPYNWIGWDFPQVDRPVERDWVSKLVRSWPERMESLDLFHFDSEHKKELKRRVSLLHRIICGNSKKPARSWHEAVFPQFKAIEAKLKYFFPNKNSTWVLFRLHWYPHVVYDWLPEDKQNEFRQWLKAVASK